MKRVLRSASASLPPAKRLRRDEDDATVSLFNQFMDPCASQEWCRVMDSSVFKTDFWVHGMDYFTKMAYSLVSKGTQARMSTILAPWPQARREFRAYAKQLRAMAEECDEPVLAATQLWYNHAPSDGQDHRQLDRLINRLIYGFPELPRLPTEPPPKPNPDRSEWELLLRLDRSRPMISRKFWLIGNAVTDCSISILSFIAELDAVEMLGGSRLTWSRHICVDLEETIIATMGYAAQEPAPRLICYLFARSEEGRSCCSTRLFVTLVNRGYLDDALAIETAFPNELERGFYYAWLLDPNRRAALTRIASVYPVSCSDAIMRSGEFDLWRQLYHEKPYDMHYAAISAPTTNFRLRCPPKGFVQTLQSHPGYVPLDVSLDGTRGSTISWAISSLHDPEYLDLLDWQPTTIPRMGWIDVLCMWLTHKSHRIALAAWQRYFAPGSDLWARAARDNRLIFALIVAVSSVEVPELLEVLKSISGVTGRLPYNPMHSTIDNTRTLARWSNCFSPGYRAQLFEHLFSSWSSFVHVEKCVDSAIEYVNIPLLSFILDDLGKRANNEFVDEMRQKLWHINQRDPVTSIFAPLKIIR